MIDDHLVVETPGDREIVLSRVFDAPAQLVFAAFTRPELLVRWYGARGWQLVGCEVDLRVDGRWRFESQGPDGQRMVQHGVYRTVDPPHEIVCTERFDEQSYPGETLVSHTFTELAGRTTVTTALRYATPEGRDTALRYPMVRGVTESFTRLAALLAADTGGLQ
ncbi:SRPBCC family protein [Micromonospora sp. C95]|uniref:SRPBCC family protein n=1 Tax=Micromonospora sp. C95 TaxID=2824882 RepID=UPI001B392A82|nr:SRPBCC family protein [Micromonospora sp. C95]MBQ1026675.1 SRPBCC family protein [Micromonospora sp. C95]